MKNLTKELMHTELSRPILDLGCGFNDSGAEVKLDYVTYVANLKSCCNILGDAQSLPFKNNSFKGISARHSFEHFYNPKMVALECYRVLKDKCRILVDVPYGLKVSEVDLEDINRKILVDDELFDYYKRNNWISWRFDKPIVDIHTVTCSLELVKSWFGKNLWREILITGGTFIYEKI